eukprot:CAMPEP_0115747634 /NCGR_PEP_ID=MMETSP0272-20121206/93261_1 /TAXON_ID=71861 /ORGANISM="Scrippsiella trochoidea, Strain CCMP3099" /LENGTH=57 /DNA_ID=CAMNT_0003192627 /DNA_START=7 /DNA_END=177 /DNA_ORIENTATION=+
MATPQPSLGGRQSAGLALLLRDLDLDPAPPCDDAPGGSGMPCRSTGASSPSLDPQLP